MTAKTRLKNIELKLSASTNSELIELLKNLKAETGDDSETPINLSPSECLKQLAEYLPA